MDKIYGLLLVSVTILVLCSVGTASATNWSVDGRGGADFTRIQDAINNAKNGDMILVYSGVYYENVVVDKSVTVRGIEHPVVDANGSDSAITLTADGITLVGFNATNSGKSQNDAGINVNTSNNNITSNNVCNNGFGIYLASSSNNNTISGNNVCDNNRDGIRIYDSSNNTITGNVFVNDGLFVYFSYQNTVEENTVNCKPLVYLEDVSDYKVEDAGQVILVNCTNITVENLDLSNTSGGITLGKTENSKISNNTVCNNNRGGIRLSSSSNNNTITGNNVSNNRGSISIKSSGNNTITGNNVCNNEEGIRLSSSSNNNTITGNNVGNNRGSISIKSSGNNTITGNNVCNNEEGISLSSSSNNNTITGNNVSNNNGIGIRLYYSSKNTITGNNVSNNNGIGIRLYYSSKNTITGNVFVNDGLSVFSSYQNTVEDNTVNGKPLVYLGDVSDYKVEDAGQVILVNCTNITVENFDLYNTSVGIDLWETKDGIISNNKVCSNKYGIRIKSSGNNKIYFNNFINNTDNVDSYKSTNIWNSPLEITYTYDGTTYKSYLGNYWDDYEGTDADGDGIGDTHYSIDSEKDESDDYPLMKPFENYIVPRSAPA